MWCPGAKGPSQQQQQKKVNFRVSAKLPCHNEHSNPGSSN